MLPTRNNQRPVGRRLLENKYRTVQFNRGLIAETGIIPTGLTFLQDSHSFRPIGKGKLSVAEGKGGREVPVYKITGLFQEADKENANGRIYPKNVLEEAVRNIQDDLNRRSVMGEFDHPCNCACNFRVLTVDGWKEFVDIKVGDYVYSRVNGNILPSRVNGITNDLYDGQAYRIHGRNINSAFTAGHKLVILNRPSRNSKRESFTILDDVYQNRNSYNHHAIPRTGEWIGEHPECVIIPGVVDARQPQHREALIFEPKKFAAFLGLYLAEGHYVKQGICIDQFSNCEVVKDLLDNLHPDLIWTIRKRGFYTSDVRLVKYLCHLGDKYTKYIPAEIKKWAPIYLEELIRWFAIGDGRMLVAGDRNARYLSCKKDIKSNNILTDAVVNTSVLDLGTYSRMSVFTVSKQLINDLHECVIKTGRCAKLSEIVTEDDYLYSGHMIKAENKQTLYQLHISRTENIYLDKRFLEIEPFRHTGNIYCLTTQYGNFYMEENGHSFWTGNCDAKIHLDRVSHLLTKVWMDGKKVMGEAEVLDNQPFGKCLRGLFEHRVETGISSRGVGDMEVRESGGEEYYEVLEGYAFVTWDCVAEPSVKGATLKVMEGLNRRTKPLREARASLKKETYERMLLQEIGRYFGMNK